MNVKMKKSFEAFGLRWSRTKERGATAVVIALCLTLLMGAAAISFDTANLALERQRLQNITDAAAQAGASYLPDTDRAKEAANEYFHRYDRTPADKSYSPTLNVYCMVESAGASKQAAAGALIAAACDPNPGHDFTYANGVGGTICDEHLCAIPCTASDAQCNAIEVSAIKDVPFYFGPAIKIDKGSTGSVTSVSCINGCGSGGVPNPVDVAIIADRTPSMSNTDFDAMKAGIKGALEIMTPEYQLVTLGTIHKSNYDSGNTDCLTSLGPPVSRTWTDGRWTYPDGGARDGKWMPLAQGNLTTGFSGSYLTGGLESPSGTRTLIETKGKQYLGYQVDCMNHYDKYNMNGYPWGTHLAAPLKAAARLLLGKDPSNLAALSKTRKDTLLTHGETVKQWIIFETDGMPEETMGLDSGSYKDSNENKGSTLLGDKLEPTAPGNTNQACQNFLDVAKRAKNSNNNIGIIMIAYGTGTENSCGGTLGTVRDVMAQAASNADNGSASKNPAECKAANTDNDYFFCAASGADLKEIFKTAIGMASSSTTKFVNMPKKS